MKNISFKLIFRSWRHNKTFTVISILSLAIGIACTNLLTAFVIYETNIEATNPNRKRIYYMSQDSPMQSGETVSYISNPIAEQIKDKYPAVIEDYLRLSTEGMSYVGIGDKRFPSILCLTADPSFLKFFPCDVLYGDLNRALTEPDKIALTKQTAKLFFGNENALGKQISFIPDSEYGFYADEVPKERTYEVVAVVKERNQSFIRFDAITSHTSNFFGGVALVLADKTVQTDEFAEQLRKDGIPTLQMEIGRYYFTSLQDSYFHNYPYEQDYINRQQKNLLYVGFIAAFLILLISCFNYINLNFSRLLQQIRAIRTQRLMGAGNNQIILQLFEDTFLTVFIAFLLSLLIAYDLLPVFNNIVGGRIPSSFFFNYQVLPYLCLFILTLSAIPALYIGRKVTRQTQQDYRALFTGNNRQRIIATLTIMQFAISIALITGAITANNQVGLISKGGDSYKGLIEVGNYMTDNSSIQLMVNELKTQLKMEEVAVSGMSVLFSGIHQIVIKHDDRSETYSSLLQLVGTNAFFEMLGIHIRQGLSLEQAIERYPHPAYINESFARILVPDNENPVGMPLNTYTTSYGKPAEDITIAGIVENFYTNSLDNEIFPAVIQLDNDESNLHYIYLRLDPKQPEMLETMQAIWEKYNPNKAFPYNNLWEVFKIRNKHIYEMYHLLIMFSLISIFLTGFGLFGMALYATEQRTKEIGIRKVNGATTLQIMLLLNRQFILWITIAFLIATPVTWIFLNRWLQNFAYRVDVTLGTCFLALLIVLVVTLLTVSWHSYKAAKANPVDSLRDE